MFKIYSMTIVIRSLIEKDNKFYPETSLTIVHTKYKNGCRVIENKNQINYFWDDMVYLDDFDVKLVKVVR